MSKLCKAPCSLCTGCISVAQYVSYSSSASWLAAVGNLSHMNHESRDKKECTIANQLQQACAVQSHLYAGKLVAEQAACGSCAGAQLHMG